jgi:hypothetical protein
VPFGLIMAALSRSELACIVTKTAAIDS